MDDKMKKFISLVAFVAIMVIVVAVLANEGVIRNALNALINWICERFNLPGITLF